MTALTRVALTVVLAAVAGCAAAPPADVHVRMQTTAGNIVLRIDTARAPITAGNFLALVDAGHLDGGTFYRTVSPANDNGSPPIAVIQGGLGEAPSPFAPIAHEPTSVTGLRHLDGSLSMARGEPGTASTEFFICIGDQPALDYGGLRNPDGQGFAVFGAVVEGMDVVRAIHAAPADAPTEVEYVRGQLIGEPIRIEAVRRVSRWNPARAAASGIAP